MKNCENCKKEHEGNYGSGRFCSPGCARGFSTKNKRSLINENLKTKIPWNRGDDFGKLKKCPSCLEDFVPKRKNRIYCSQKCQNDFLFKGKHRSEETRKLIRDSTLDLYKKGKRVFGGTTKWFDYNGIRVQGTYELRTCQILDIWKSYNVIKDWEYTKDRVDYIGEDGKKHSYLLDFKVFTNEGFFYYIEVKGYEHSNDPLKWKAVRDKGHKLEVWFEKDIIKNEMVYVA